METINFTIKDLIENLKKYPESALIEFVHEGIILYLQSATHEKHSLGKQPKFPNGKPIYEILSFDMTPEIPDWMYIKEKE